MSLKKNRVLKEGREFYQGFLSKSWFLSRIDNRSPFFGEVSARRKEVSDFFSFGEDSFLGLKRLYKFEEWSWLRGRLEKKNLLSKFWLCSPWFMEKQFQIKKEEGRVGERFQGDFPWFNLLDSFCTVGDYLLLGRVKKNFFLIKGSEKESFLWCWRLALYREMVRVPEAHLLKRVSLWGCSKFSFVSLRRWGVGTGVLWIQGGDDGERKGGGYVEGQGLLDFGSVKRNEVEKFFKRIGAWREYDRLLSSESLRVWGGKVKEKYSSQVRFVLFSDSRIGEGEGGSWGVKDCTLVWGKGRERELFSEGVAPGVYYLSWKNLWISHFFSWGSGSFGKNVKGITKRVGISLGPMESSWRRSQVISLHVRSSWTQESPVKMEVLDLDELPSVLVAKSVKTRWRVAWEGEDSASSIFEEVIWEGKGCVRLKGKKIYFYELEIK